MTVTGYNHKSKIHSILMLLIYRRGNAKRGSDFALPLSPGSANIFTEPYGNLKNSVLIYLIVRTSLIAAAAKNEDYSKNYNPGAVIIEKMA